LAAQAAMQTICSIIRQGIVSVCLPSHIRSGNYGGSTFERHVSHFQFEEGQQHATAQASKAPNIPNNIPCRSLCDDIDGELWRLARVDWQFNVRLWDTAAISGISCETLAD